MSELIYLVDDLESVILRIMSDKELIDCDLTEGNIKRTIYSFKGDEIACSVFLKKYALRDENNKIIEFTLEEAKDRWANAIVEAERIFGADEEKVNKMKSEFRELYDHMLPAGRQMFALGNNIQKNLTYSNCYVTGINSDSIEGIYDAASKLAKTYSYGGGIGTDIGCLRPRLAKVSNSARHSTGAVSFMELFSLTTGLIGQCIAKDQLVLAERGLIKIQEIIAGVDKVWTKKGFVNVLKVIKNGEKQIITVEDSFGFKLNATNNHIVLTEKNGDFLEKKISELSINDSIILIPGVQTDKPNIKLNTSVDSNYGSRTNYNVILPEYLDEKLAYIIGYSYGDGHVGHGKNGDRYNLNLASSHDWPRIENKLISYIKDIFNYDAFVKSGDGRCNYISIYNKVIINYLYKNKILKQKSDCIIFPECILNSSSNIQMAFISGFFDADGYASGPKKGYVFSSISKSFLQSVKIVLMSNGIVTQNHSEDRSNKGWKTLYSLSVVGAHAQDLFINFMKESIKVISLCHISKRDRVVTPYKAKKLGIKYNNYNYMPSDSYISTNCFSKFKKENDHNNILPSNILVKSYIKKIIANGVSETFDLVLEDEHLFFCEGFYVHNSGRRGALMLTIPVDHPDIEEFVEIKHNNIDKVKHANISVKLTDEFMKAVENDSDFTLRFDTKHEKIRKTVRAKELWSKIVQSARDSAEPGLLFWDRAMEMSPSDNYERLQVHSTNPCLTGETLVYVADGRSFVPIKQLAEEDKDVPVFCLNKDGKIAIRYMRHPRITGYNQQVYKITLDDGNVLRTTGNHKFLLRNGECKEVKDLVNGDSLFLLTKVEEKFKKRRYGKKSNHGYNWLMMKGIKYVIEHRAIADFFYGLKDSEVVHHKDFDSRNNNPENLEVISKEEHDYLHRVNMFGDNNPMRRAKCEWSEDDWNTYKNKLSSVTSGKLNPRFSGVSNEKLKKHAIKLTKQLGHRFSVKDWQNYAKKNKLVQQFSKWRADCFGNITDFAKWAAIQCNLDEELLNLDPRTQKVYLKLVKEGYSCCIKEKDIFIKKNCKICHREYELHFSRRESCICSTSCSLKYINENRSLQALKNKKIDNGEKQLKAYVDLRNKLNRNPRKKEWEFYCKESNIPYNIGKSSFFNTFGELIERASAYNHKIISVEPDGFETVYNGTVDDFHNFFIGGFEGLTCSGKKKFSCFNNLNCGEQNLEIGGSCVLSSIILNSYVTNPYTENAYFDFEKFKRMVSLGVRHLDNVIELNFNKHALQEQEESARLGRRIGLGFTGLSDMFIALGIKYDSKDAIDLLESILSFKRDVEYTASIELSKERGAFPLFDASKHYDYGFGKTLPDNIKELGKKYGQRNICISTVAPSGSLSIIAQCSSGIEPVFAFKYKRFTELGTNVRKEFIVHHQGLTRYFKAVGTDIIPDYCVEAHNVDWRFRVKLQSVAQKYIDSSISSTINLPSDVTTEEVSDIYINAWKEGLKGITVYREGSREGVLVTDEFARQASIETDTIIYKFRAEGGDKFYIPVSYKNGDLRNPYQVFVLNYKAQENDRFIKISNELIKMLREKGVDPDRIDKYIDRSYNSVVKLTRFISLSMKTGNFEDCMKVLENHAFTGTLAAELHKIFSRSVNSIKNACPECSGTNMRMEEGCAKCLDCGTTLCG